MSSNSQQHDSRGSKIFRVISYASIVGCNFMLLLFARCEMMLYIDMKAIDLQLRLTVLVYIEAKQIWEGMDMN